MTKNKTFKRVIAGAMACALVAGAVPAQTFDKGWFGFAPVVASAEGEQAAEELSELTVYEGETKSDHTPAYIFYFDNYSRSQVVIPAADLEDMTGAKIKKIQFHTSLSYVPYTTSVPVDVYIKEVDYTSISSYETESDCTTVYQGILSVEKKISEGLMTIEFNEPFEYGGRNLLIGIENTQRGGYKHIYFKGQTVTGASIASYNNSLDGIEASQQDFIPMTTFFYEEGTHDEYKVEITGGGNADASGGDIEQNNVDHYMDRVTFTAKDGYVFEKFETKKKDGINIKWVNRKTVEVFGCPKSDTTVEVPDADEAPILEEDFEGLTDGALPDGWKSVSTDDPDYKWISKIGDNDTDTGAYSGGMNVSIPHKSEGYTAFLTTPYLDPSEYSSATLSLAYINREWSGDTDGLGVYYRIGTGEWNELFNTTENHEIWTKLELELPEAALANNMQIGFKATDGYGYDPAIDNVVLTGTKKTTGEKTDISTADVTVNTTAKTVSAELDGESLDSEGYTVKYYKANDETDEGSETFPTEGGKYIAKITAKPDSGYTGVGVSEVFVIDKLIEGTHMITTTKNDKPYTRVIFAVPKADLAGVQSITFTVTKDGVTKTATSKKYYSGSALDDVTYTPASSDLALLCVSVSNATADQIECSYTLNR